MGLAYTLAKGEGWTGWNPDILEADPTGELNRICFWGPTGNNRTHNLVVNYSYMIPNALPDTPVAKWILGDWQVSGVTKYLSGTATQPTCSTNNTGIANTNPTLTPGVTCECVLHGRADLRGDAGSESARRGSAALQPAAFTMAQPFSATVGNFGNVPDGILRQPGWWNWDLTLARRFPVPQARPRRAGARAAAALQHLQPGAVHHDEHEPAVPGRPGRARTGQPAPDDAPIPAATRRRFEPRQFGITVRFEF